MLMARQGDGGEGGPSGLRRNAMEEVWSVFGAAGLYSPWAGMLTASAAMYVPLVVFFLFLLFPPPLPPRPSLLLRTE